MIPTIPGSDPGDEDDGFTRDADGARQAQDEAREATQERSDHLMDLARQLDNDAMREQAIESLEGVKRAHEPPPPEPWVRRL